MAGLLDFIGKLRGQMLLAQEQSMQPLQQQAGQLHGQAFRGILNNPDLGVAGAGNLGLLLQSPDPEARQMGRELVGQYLVGRSPLGALQRRIAEQQLSNEKVGAQQRATEFGRRLEEYQYGVSQRPAEERRAGLQERVLEAQLGAAGAQASSARVADQLGAIRFMSDKYQTNMKAPVEVADAVQQIDGSLKVGNSLGGLAAVIKLAKILDPTSVVREGEVTTVEGGIGTAQSLISTFNRLFSKGWSPEAAKQFDAVVKQVAGPILQRGLRLNQEYATLAGQFEVNPEVVVTGVGFPTGYVTRWLSGVPDPEVETTY